MTYLRTFSSLLAASAAIVALAGCSTSAAEAPVAEQSGSETARPVSSSAPGPDTVQLGGAVQHPLDLTEERLRSFAPQSASVEFDSSKGTQAHTYVGALLSEVIESADPTEPEGKNPLLRLVVRAAGSDGYIAVLAFGEFSPDFAGTPVLVAYQEDGRALERPRLVVPGDKKGGRYVSDLTSLTVVDTGA